MFVHGEAVKEHISSDYRVCVFRWLRPPSVSKPSSVLVLPLAGGRPSCLPPGPPPPAPCPKMPLITQQGRRPSYPSPAPGESSWDALSEGQGAGDAWLPPLEWCGAGVGMGAWTLHSLPAHTRASVHLNWTFEPSWISLIFQLVKNPPVMWETCVRSLGWEDPLEKGKATHYSILAWRIPWTV